MFNRFALSFAALTLFAAAPVFANGSHADKGASRQGDIDMVNYGTAFTGANGVTETPYINGTLLSTDPDETIDIFGIPKNFESGTSYVMTFASLAANADGAVYGIFDCDNGTSSTPVSADNVNMTGPCTAEPVGTGDGFISFNENDTAKTVTITINGTGAPSQFFFWTTAGNLTNLSPTSGTGTMPEPTTYAMLGAGLLALALMRRRTAAAL
jgi:hypothetical protein